MPALTLSGQTKQRQIVILAVGGVLLAGLLMFQVPRTLDMLKSEAPPAPQTTPATTTPVTTPPASPGTPPPLTTPEAPRQTASLTRFTSKDPFVQQIGASSGAPSGSPAESAAPSSSASGSGTEAGAGSSSGSASGSNTATIAMNGAQHTVSVSDTFPKGNPVFKLVSLNGDTAKIGVENGELKGGSQTVTLTKGEPLTLLNTVDGKRYKLELVSVSE
jgi:hypothetical protein